MSGLLESIARRRRASASRRLGPRTADNGAGPAGSRPPSPNGAPAPLTASPAPPAAPPERNPAPPEAPLAPPEAPPEPAPEPTPPPAARTEAPGRDAPTTLLSRGHVRRRVRYLRRLREIQLRDIGGFLLELHRAGRQRDDLVQAKLEGAARTDRELRELERALREPVTVGELREAGIGGACESCGAVYGSTDRFCSWCGTQLSPHA